MKLNRRTDPIHTHEGAIAKRINPEQQLRRLVMSCMLWEREFYVDGEKIADQIVTAARAVDRDTLSQIAIETRHVANLRHVPLLLLTVLCERGGSGVADTIEKVIGRVDEMAELLAIYWRDGKKPIPKQMKLGLARSFEKFDEYQFGKYRGTGAIKLRDVVRLVHPAPKDVERSALYARIIDDTLKTPDTWEVALSGGADKREAFERLLREGKLGYMALLRNLRNMVNADVDRTLITDAIAARKGAGRVLPFRFVAAARACPQMEPALDAAMVASITHGSPTFDGQTIILVDVSGSMTCRLSERSDMSRIDAACALASIISGQRRVFSFSGFLVEVPPRLGMAGVDAIRNSQPHGGTDLGGAIRRINRSVPHDRLIVITDEQAGAYYNRIPDPVCDKAYMINVASHHNGVGYGKWTHIDGFSENVLRFISAKEA